MLSPLLSLWGLHSPPRGSCSCSSLTPAHEVRFSPITPHFLCTSLMFFRVGISLSLFTVGAELSKPFAKYLSASTTWSCRGTLWLVTSAYCPRFVFGKASAPVTLVGSLKRLDCLLLPILPLSPAWSLSRSAVTATYLPLFPPPQLAPYCSPFHRRPLVGIHKPPSIMPVLLAVANAALAHPPGAPHQSHLDPPIHPALGHRFVPRHRSGVQVHTLTS